jgi:hypothetical protein
MSDKINSNATFTAENEFNLAFGWLAATAVTIASWAGLS